MYNELWNSIKKGKNPARVSQQQHRGTLCRKHGFVI